MMKDAKEKELENALISHLKKFMLELGRGFAWIGNQKELNIAGDEFFLDLLFYNYHMHCFVVFELKVEKFKAEMAGKLNFYVNAIDAQLKSERDAPTIGILLCKTANETVVKYSLQDIDSPIGVTNYQFDKSLPPHLKAELPSEAELEKELEFGYEKLKGEPDSRIERLKDMLKTLKNTDRKRMISQEQMVTMVEKLILDLSDGGDNYSK